MYYKIEITRQNTCLHLGTMVLFQNSNCRVSQGAVQPPTYGSPTLCKVMFDIQTC